MEGQSTPTTSDGTEQDAATIFTALPLVTILVGPSKIKHVAHKQILISRCPFFAACLQSEMQEAATHVVELPKESSAAFDQVMTYMYTGKVDPIKKREDHENQIRDSITGMETWALADKFLMPELRDQMMDVLSEYWHECYVYPQAVSWVLDNAPHNSEFCTFVRNRFSDNFAAASLDNLTGFLQWNEFRDGLRDLFATYLEVVTELFSFSVLICSNAMRKTFP